MNMPMINMKKILLVGGAGYIGSTLARKLIKDNWHVTCLDSLLYDEMSLNGLPGAQLRLINNSISDISNLIDCIIDVDYVIHLAGLVGDPSCSIDSGLTEEFNVIGTKIVWELSKKYKVKKFIFLSSCSVYGINEGIADENTKVNPISEYAWSKYRSEMDLLSTQNSSTELVILRLSTVFGMSYRMRFDLVVNYFSYLAANNRDLTVFNGNSFRPFISVDDLSRAIVYILSDENNNNNNQIYNIGDNTNNYTISQIAEIVQSVNPKIKIIENESNGSDLRDYNVSFNKFNNKFNFSSEVSIKSEVEKIISYVSQNNLTRDDNLNKKYNNYEMTKYIFATREKFYKSNLI
jgi:nucleoside-diphosphate-sugar epimerase